MSSNKFFVALVVVVGLSFASSRVHADPEDEPDRTPSRCTAPTAKGQPPYLTAPTDPWLGVADDAPAVVRLRANTIYPPVWSERSEERDCTAAHDHCLRDCTWFLQNSDTKSKHVVAVHVLAERSRDRGTLRRMNMGYGDIRLDDGDAMYRTVPATRSNLVVGARAISIGSKGPTSERDALVGLWAFGTVASIDWEHGQMHLIGDPAAIWISSVRVVVLSYAKGGKVRIVGDRKPEQLAVKPNEVILPPERGAARSDPWAQVGKDGRPVSVAKDRRLSSEWETCDGAHDHCLRQWAWFVGKDALRVARFENGTFYRADTDAAVDPGPAYRTIAARRQDIIPGGSIIVYSSNKPPGNESQAHEPWSMVEIGDVDKVGSFTIKGDTARTPTRYPLAAARKAVLIWLPGDKAERID